MSKTPDEILEEQANRAGKTLIDKQLLKPLTEEERKTSNVDGNLGPICNYCGGLGWTNVLGGGTLKCKDCEGTGIQTMTRQQLQEEILECKDMIRQMIEHLIDEGVILKGMKFMKSKKGGKK